MLSPFCHPLEIAFDSFFDLLSLCHFIILILGVEIVLLPHLLGSSSFTRFACCDLGAVNEITDLMKVLTEHLHRLGGDVDQLPRSFADVHHLCEACISPQTERARHKVTKVCRVKCATLPCVGS